MVAATMPLRDGVRDRRPRWAGAARADADAERARQCERDARPLPRTTRRELAHDAEVTGLPALPKGQTYTLWLTKDGELAASSAASSSSREGRRACRATPPSASGSLQPGWSCERARGPIVLRTPDGAARTCPRCCVGRQGRPTSGRARRHRSHPTQYEDFARHVLTHGVPKHDRTGTGTVSVFGQQMRFDLARGLSARHDEEGALQSIAYELLWFLRARRTCAGCRSTASRSGTSGPTPTAISGPSTASSGAAGRRRTAATIDQIAEVVRLLREDPDSRRIIVSAWNVGDLPKMALPPCHAFFQFYVAPGAGAAAQLPALPAQRRRLPRRPVQHRELRAAHAHARAAVRPRRRRSRLDRRRLPHLRQPPRAGRDPARARAVPVPDAATSGAGPTRSSTTRSRTSRSSTTSTTRRSARRSRCESRCRSRSLPPSRAAA